MIDKLHRRFPALGRVPPPAFAVGGAVRDLLLGRDPADVDVICSDAERCARALGNPFRLGRDRFDAWRVSAGGHLYDFTSHHGDVLADDLARRDFTINAIAVDLTTGAVSDPFGGRADIERRTIRMIHPENFDDDPLRTLKAVRMAVTLGFEIEPETIEAIRGRAPQIASIAAERVSYELSVIFGARRFRRAVALLHETKLDRPLFGRDLEAEPFQADDIGEPASFALLVDDPARFAKRWRWSESLLREVSGVRRLAAALDCGGLAPQILLYDAGKAVARDTVDYLRARGDVEGAGAIESLATDALFEIRPLLTGDEIATITGLRPGPELGARKRALLEAQILGEVRTREEAEAFVQISG